MTGFELHSERHELHGITVVVETTGEMTYVARFDLQDERGVHLINVAQHTPSSGQPLDEFLARTRKFGVKAERKHLVVPASDITRIRRLSEMPP